MMLRRMFLMLVATTISAVAGMVFKRKLDYEKRTIELPEPRLVGTISVGEAIARRRSRRSYSF